MFEFEVGDRVQVVSSSFYSDKYKGCHGEISQTYNKSGEIMLGVTLDGKTNQKSSKGVFWFLSEALVYESEGESFMFNNFRVAEIKFFDEKCGNTYFYALYDHDIEDGDNVIVSTGHHGYAIAEVFGISEAPEDKKKVTCNREVVCKVDFTKFFARKSAEKKAKELKKNMDKRIKEAQELAMYEALAEKDDVLKSMFNEYKGILEEMK